MTLGATIIIDCNGEVTMVIGTSRFAVRGALARGLRALATAERNRLEAAGYAT